MNSARVSGAPLRSVTPQTGSTPRTCTPSAGSANFRPGRAGSTSDAKLTVSAPAAPNASVSSRFAVGTPPLVDQYSVLVVRIAGRRPGSPAGPLGARDS